MLSHTMTLTCCLAVLLLIVPSLQCHAFVVPTMGRLAVDRSHHDNNVPRYQLRQLQQQKQQPKCLLIIQMAATGEEKAAPLISGADLEVMLADLDTPLVIDAYATWCGPCLLMAPEFEEAAQELQGKVRFAKLDTDQDEAMAARLNIMGLPTLLFLDKYEAPEGEDDMGARAVLKGRIEGALRKQNILDLCNYHFFNGPEPKIV